MRTETVRAKVNRETKIGAEEVLHMLGLSMSDAINLLLVQIKMRQALPFDVAIPKLPNQETREILEQTDAGEGLIHCRDTDDLFKQAGIE